MYHISEEAKLVHCIVLAWCFSFWLIVFAKYAQIEGLPSRNKSDPEKKSLTSWIKVFKQALIESDLLDILCHHWLNRDPAHVCHCQALESQVLVAGGVFEDGLHPSLEVKLWSWICMLVIKLSDVFVHYIFIFNDFHTVAVNASCTNK